MSLLHEDDTIVAIATPAGPGGIGVVRMSGALAPRVFMRVFRSNTPVSRPASHHLYYGWIVDPEKDTAVDEVLAVLMRSPRSYTREDVLEIQCHSGPAVLSRILDICLAQGARLADPGEFTRRAFLNGRIDLVQAEAVAEIASARSHSAGKLAMAQLQGHLSSRVQDIRMALKDCLAFLEASIDYPEEDMDMMDCSGMEERLVTGALQPLEHLLAEFERGRIFRQGVNVLIAGRPNVGKSSLLNALLCEDRAIVTPVPGTTRDPVEAELHINGMLARFIDTAGIRPDPGPVEEIGIRKVSDLLTSAHIILWLVEAGQALHVDDLKAGEFIAENDRLADTILVCAKSDLAGSIDEPGDCSRRIVRAVQKEFPDAGISRHLVISARTGQGLQELQEAVACRIMEAAGPEPPDNGINARHREILGRVLHSVRRGLNCVRMDLSPEFTAIDLRAALSNLGEVTGDGVTEEVLDHLFSSFCLGK